MSVGCENVGTRRSTRAASGATSSPLTSGCGIDRDDAPAARRAMGPQYLHPNQVMGLAEVARDPDRGIPRTGRVQVDGPQAPSVEQDRGVAHLRPAERAERQPVADEAERDRRAGVVALHVGAGAGAGVLDGPPRSVDGRRVAVQPSAEKEGVDPHARPLRARSLRPQDSDRELVRPAPEAGEAMAGAALEPPRADVERPPPLPPARHPGPAPGPPP